MSPKSRCYWAEVAQDYILSTSKRAVLVSKKVLDYGLNKPLYSNNGRSVDTLKGAHIASIEEKQLFLSLHHIDTVFI